MTIAKIVTHPDPAKFGIVLNGNKMWPFEVEMD